jgi:hypothetical protein
MESINIKAPPERRHLLGQRLLATLDQAQSAS